MRTLLVYCHPDHESFVAAVRDAALAGLHDGGHETRVTDLYAEGFDPVFSAEDHANHKLDHRADHHPDFATSGSIASHAADLHWCESLVLVYPTWWAGQPAMLKGWFDRVLVNGIAWELSAGSTRVRPLLRNVRRITVVTTHGSSKLINALEGEPGKRTASRSLRLLCARTCRTRWIAMYTVDRSTPLERAAFVNRVQRRLAE